MRTVGIIAEYNPFHNGHAWQMAEAKKRARADTVIVEMSTSFTQRGEPAILSAADRARLALEAGADAVFALPAVWAVRDAEHFALGGVSVLAKLGCDAISFGAESEDAELMRRTASLLEENPPELHLRMAEQTGKSYPAAMAAACERLLPGSGTLLASPNNTLGVCYLRAIQRLGARMEPVIIRRDNDYHGTEIGKGGFSSAAAVRAACSEGDLDRIGGAVPESALQMLREKNNADISRLDQVLMYRLLTMPEEDFHRLPDVSEGIENRLRSAVRLCAGRSELIEAVKTKRYPYARISRMCAHALLGLTDENLKELPLPEPWLIGMRPSAAPLMKAAQEKGTRILSRAGDLDPNALWVQKEILANDLRQLAGGEIPEPLQSQRLVRVDNGR